jgi:DNA-binding response OmpR family regulator
MWTKDTVTRSALVLCCDAQALDTTKRTLHAHNMQTTVFVTSSAAGSSLRHNKFDLSVLDLDVPGANYLLGLLETNGVLGVVIALGGSMAVPKIALSKQVHFVLTRPFSADLLAKTVKAAHSMVSLGKRPAHRHETKIVASASFFQDGVQQDLRNATVTDISITGLSLKSSKVLPKGVTLSINLHVPGNFAIIRATGKVIWSNDHFQAGIEFSLMPPAEHRKLCEWLDSQPPGEPALVGYVPAYQTEAEKSREAAL